MGCEDCMCIKVEDPVACTSLQGHEGRTGLALVR